MTEIVTTAKVTRGKLHVRNWNRVQERLEHSKDGEYVIRIQRKHAIRSKALNAYYWSVVIARVQRAFKEKQIDAGDDPEVTHEVLKAQFMDPELVRTGDIRGFISDTGLTLGTHTPDLNTLQFIEYLDRIVDHAAEYWDCYIPPPDPMWREHAEQERYRDASDVER